MNKQIIVMEMPEVEIIGDRLPRFEAPIGAIRLNDAAHIANALARLASGQRLEGIIDFATAIGLKVKF